MLSAGLSTAEPPFELRSSPSAAGALLRLRNVVPRGESVWVVGAQSALAVGQGLLVQRDGLVGAALATELSIDADRSGSAG
jgi:hypothetical protein